MTIRPDTVVSAVASCRFGARGTSGQCKRLETEAQSSIRIACGASRSASCATGAGSDSSPRRSPILRWYLSFFLTGIGLPLSTAWGGPGGTGTRFLLSFRTRSHASGRRMTDSRHLAHGDSAASGNDTISRRMYGLRTGHPERGPRPCHQCGLNALERLREFLLQRKRRLEGQLEPAHRHPDPAFSPHPNSARTSSPRRQ